MDHRPFYRGIQWFVNGAFNGALDKPVAEWCEQSLERKFEEIGALFNDSMNDLIGRNRQVAHQKAAEKVYHLGDRGVQFIPELRGMLKFSYEERRKGLEYAILALRHHGLDAAPALPEIAAMGGPNMGIGYGLQNEVALTLRILGNKIIESQDERLLTHLEKAIPIIVSSFSSSKGEAITAFADLAVTSIAGGHDKLSTSFMAHLKDVDRCMDIPVLKDRANEALTMIRQAHFARIGTRSTINFKPDSIANSL